MNDYYHCRVCDKVVKRDDLWAVTTGPYAYFCETCRKDPNRSKLVKKFNPFRKATT